MRLKFSLLLARRSSRAASLPPKEESASPPARPSATWGSTGAAVEPAAEGWWNSFKIPSWIG